MSGFTLLWSKILRSSLWVQESKETRLVWITMIALKDKDGNVYSSVVGLADTAKVSPDECREALKRLMSPDPNDTSKVNKGIRITEIKGGWHIVNHDLYRFSSEERRMIWAEQKAKQRKKKKSKTPVSGSTGEREYENAVKRGATQEELDAIVTRHLPDGLREEPPEYKVPTPITQPPV